MHFPTSYSEVCTLPSKSEFFVFVNNIQVQWNKVCYKVSLCENFQQQSCRRTIPILTADRQRS